jgi:prolyl-tRNA editing enzyme YbaK/EbsC (Cys-tRNA(Pro) deacylase)
MLPCTAYLLLFAASTTTALQQPWPLWRALTPRLPGGRLDDYLSDARAAAVQVPSAAASGTAIKSLCFDTDAGGHVVAVVRATDGVDTARLASAIGAQTAKLSRPDAVEAATGFGVGCVPPVGVATPVVVDDAVAALRGRVVGGAGDEARQLVIRDGAELLRLSAGIRADIRGSGRPKTAPTYRAQGFDATGRNVTIVGRIASKRQMAKKLCFVTLTPPGGGRWRPLGRLLPYPDVELQVILGATLVRQRGDDAAANVIRRLRVGQVVVCDCVPTWRDRPTVLGRFIERWRQVHRRRQIDLRCSDVGTVRGFGGAGDKPRTRRPATAPLQYLELPQDVAFHYVTATSEAPAAVAALAGAAVVGLDAEWEPDSPSDAPAATVQLATSDACVVLDLVALATNEGGLAAADAVVAAALENALLVGFGLETDLARCRPLLASLDAPETRELQGTASSLAALVRRTLGRDLDKRLQRSAWGTMPRPLPDDCVKYAALDAYACVLAYDALDGEPMEPAPAARDLRVTEDVVERCLGRGRDRKRGEHPKDASLCFATGEEAISGYDKRGGAVRLADGSVLFVNWQGQQKCKTYFDRKYPNALRPDGTVTWWPPKNFDEERLSEPLHLFGRRGKSNFLYLGRLAYVGPLAETGAAPGGLVLKLLDAEELERRAGDGDAQPGLRALLDAAAAVVVV